MKYLLLTTFAFCIVACSNQEKAASNETQTEAPAIAKNSQIDEKKTTIKDPYKSPGKPSAPITLEYSFEGKPTLGQRLNVHVKLKGAQKEESVSASLKYSPSLVADTPNNKLSFKPSAPNTEIVTITPTENGIYFININASTVVNGKTMYKSFAIPVEVGDADWAEHNKPEGTLLNDSKDGKVISLPAAEL